MAHEPSLRACYTCDITKPLEQFARNKSKPWGYDYQCLVCHKEIERRRRACWTSEQRKVASKKAAEWGRAHLEQRRFNRRKYYWRHREASLRREKLREMRLKLEVLEYYSSGPPRCACCAEDGLGFLTIDHINGRIDETEHRTGRKLYTWLRDNSFPLGFQVLCFNCNSAKGIYGECPHKKVSPQLA